MFPAPKPDVKKLNIILNSSKKDILESVEIFKTNTSRTLTEDIITLVISWRPFGILRFEKNPQGIETHIRRGIITKMLVMHNQ